MGCFILKIKRIYNLVNYAKLLKIYNIMCIIFLVTKKVTKLKINNRAIYLCVIYKLLK